MILKVRSDTSWHYYEKITDPEVIYDVNVRVKKEDSERPCGLEFANTFEDLVTIETYTPVRFHSKNTLSRDKVGRCTIVKYIKEGDNVDRCVAFNTIAFLLNDDGKNIDRL